LTANFTTDAASLLLDARGVIEPAKDRGAVPVGRAPAENSFANLVMSRRSIRRYRPEPVDEVLVERIMAHATWAPSRALSTAIARPFPGGASGSAEG